MCRECEWETWLDEIDDLVLDGRYDWADETLSGIRAWVEENEHITEKQIIAVENIRDGLKSK